MPDKTPRVLDSSASGGMESASNLAIEASRSEYIAIHDDDDTWHPDFLARLVGHLDEDPDQIGAVSRTVIVWERVVDNEIAETGREPFGEALSDVLLIDSLLFNRFVPIAFLYRRSAHHAVGMYRGDLPVVGDWEFNLRLLAGRDVGIIEGAPLAFWHQRREGLYGNSVTAARAEHRRYDGLVRNEAVTSYIRDHGVGLPLFLAGLVDGRLAQVEAGLTARIAELEDRLVDAVVRARPLRNEDRLTPQLRGLLRAVPRRLLLGRGRGRGPS